MALQFGPHSVSIQRYLEFIHERKELDEKKASELDS
jgi:hypothetical protein